MPEKTTKKPPSSVAKGAQNLKDSKKVLPPKKDLSSKSMSPSKRSSNVAKGAQNLKDSKKVLPSKKDLSSKSMSPPKRSSNFAKVSLPALSFFRERYLKKIRPELQKKLGYKNIHQVPSLEKVVLNMGVGDASREKGKIEKACQDMTFIAGQRAIITRARCSVAAFKLRAGMPAGVKVTLRKRRMYEFLERVIYIALPSVRDFRGLSPKSFDQNGNYSFGIKEHIVFPEISYDNVEATRGLDITVCTTARDHEEARILLEHFSFPFIGESRV